MAVLSSAHFRGRDLVARSFELTLPGPIGQSARLTELRVIGGSGSFE